MALLDTIYRWQYHGRQWLTGRICCLRLGGPAAEPSIPPRRALIVISGLLGDTVMSTPLVIASRRLWPQARITLLGQARNCALLSSFPLIDECFETPAIPFNLRRRRGIAQLEQWLRNRDFDLAIIALGDQFARLLAKVGIPVRVGVRGHVLEPCLTHTYDIGCPRTWGPSERLNALRVLGYQVEDVLPQLWVSEPARAAARSWLLSQGLAPATPYVVVHPFGSTKRQWWSPVRAIELAEALWREHGLRTVLVGGPETRGQVERSDANVLDATGALSVEALMGVIDSAHLVISTDSGPFHIAGALRRPLVGLFRARRPEHAGLYPQARVIFGRHPSCAQRCGWDRCRELPCQQLQALSASKVLDVVRFYPNCHDTEPISGRNGT